MLSWAWMNIIVLEAHLLSAAVLRVRIIKIRHVLWSIVSTELAMILCINTFWYHIKSVLVQQVVEAGLGHLPFAEHTVTTPTGSQYVGVNFAKKLCGVSIIRSGESMENALRACCKGIKIGKILIHR